MKKGFWMLLIALSIPLAFAAAVGLRKVLFNGRLARVRADYQSIWKAENAFALDNCGLNYVADTTDRRRDDPAAPLTFEWSYTFHKQHGGKFALLTTPCSYLSTIPTDPFRRDGGYYGYFSSKTNNNPDWVPILGVVRSVGPDGVEDLPLAEMKKQVDNLLQQLPPVALWQNPSLKWCIRDMIDPYMYDPSNGTDSRGDLIVIMDRNREYYGYAWASSSPEWLNLPLSKRYPMTLGPVQMAAGWSLDQPIPPPKNYTEDQWTQMRMDISPGFIDFSQYAKIKLITINGDYRLYDSSANCLSVEDRLNKLRDHFSPFASFFAHPGLLTAEQRDQLDRWRSADLDWWEAIPMEVGVQCSIPRAYSCSPTDFYRFLVFYGKCRLLEAARLATAGATSEAQNQVKALDRLLREISENWTIDGKKAQAAQNPYFARIHSELSRMCAEMLHTLESASEKK